MGYIPGYVILEEFFTLKESQWYWVYCGVDDVNNNIYLSYSSKEKYLEHRILNLSISNISQLQNPSYILIGNSQNDSYYGQNFDIRSFKYYNSLIYRTVPEVLKLLMKEICIFIIIFT